MHWRCFAIKDISIEDENSFRDWLLARWREKEALLEYYTENGQFPASKGPTTHFRQEKSCGNAEHFEVKLRPRSVLEVLPIFVPPATLVVATMAITQLSAITLGILGRV